MACYYFVTCTLFQCRRSWIHAVSRLDRSSITLKTESSLLYFTNVTVLCVDILSHILFTPFRLHIAVVSFDPSVKVIRALLEANPRAAMEKVSFVCTDILIRCFLYTMHSKLLFIPYHEMKC